MKRSMLIGLAALAIAASAQAEVAVITHPDAAVSPSQAQVSNIFLGKDKSLTGVDQKAWTPAKEAFYAGLTSKNEAQLKAYWSGLVFTGKGQPLASVENDAAVVAKVAGDAGAIGYVDSAAVNGSVKVLFTLP